MKKNKKQLSIFKRIGLIAIALFSALGSLFIPFASQKQNIFASAVVALPGVSPIPSPDSDFTFVTGVQFTGSDIFVVNTTTSASSSLVTDFSFYPDNGLYSQEYNYFQMQFGLAILSDSFVLDYKAVRAGNRYITNDSPKYSDFNRVAITDLGIQDLRDAFVPDSYINISSYTPMQKVIFNNNTVGYVNFGFQIFKNNSGISEFVLPSFDMNYLLLMNYTEVESVLGIPYNGLYDSCNVICYVDSNGYYFLIYIPSDNFYSEGSSNYFYSYRRYILKEPDFTDSQLYNKGYQDGLSSNQQSIYNNGYNVGLIEGESIGYDKGVLEANDYSFKSLFGAVIDAPIQAFSGLFNFEFLGVNLLDFFLGILTFGVIIFVIKLLLGGK